MDDVIISKVSSVQRCVRRAREAFGAAQDFENDFNLQDAANLNVLRACELAIDLAAHLIRIRKLGVPVESRDAFLLLREARLISEPLCKSLMSMVGFRNIVVHDYQEVDINIVIDVIQNRLDDVLQFTDVVLDLTE